MTRIHTQTWIAIIAACIGSLFAGWLITASFSKHITTLNNHIDTYVYSVCQNSRISIDIPEGQCGYAQDYFQREYLCKHNNTNPNTQCWVERK